MNAVPRSVSRNNLSMHHRRARSYDGWVSSLRWHLIDAASSAASSVRGVKSMLRRKLSQSISSYQFQAFCRDYVLEAEDWYFVASAFSSGDVYLMASLARAFRVEHGGGRIVFLTRPQHQFIPELFASVDSAVAVEPYVTQGVKERTWLWREDCPKGRFYKPALLGPVAMVGCRGTTIFDAWRAVMRVPWDALSERPRLPTDREREEARALLSRLELSSGKFALLCPDAQSTRELPELPDDLWRQLATSLRARGVVPVTNLGPQTRIIDGTTGARIPLPLLRAFAMEAGWIVAKRSGLCDILSDLPIRLAVLYPKGKFFGDRFINVASFSAMGTPSRAFEKEVDETNYMQVASQLASDESWASFIS